MWCSFVVQFCTGRAGFKGPSLVLEPGSFLQVESHKGMRRALPPPPRALEWVGRMLGGGKSEKRREENEEGHKTKSATTVGTGA